MKTITQEDMDLFHSGAPNTDGAKLVSANRNAEGSYRTLTQEDMDAFYLDMVKNHYTETAHSCGFWKGWIIGFLMGCGGGVLLLTLLQIVS